MLVAAVAAAGGCAVDDETTGQAEGAQTDTGPVVWATEQWKDRAAWYTNAQGTHLLDYGVFMALERADAEEPLASRKSLERFGFVYPMAEAAGRLTSDARLPLGVIKDRDESRKQDFVGFTCATCHTGEIDYKGKRILVDGGQTFLDLEPFLVALQRSLSATQKEPARKSRFCQKLGDAAQCETRLRDAKARIDGIRARNKQTVADGPGRLDAVSRILNEVFSPKDMGGQLGGEKPVDVQVPVSIPHVWDASRLTCVQTNCLSTNSMTRNIGEVLGVFGHSKIVVADDKTGKLAVEASPKIENLYALEHSLESLESPKWADNFGPLDDGKVKAGEKIFEKTCASCHTEPYKKTPGSIVVEQYMGQSRDLWKVTTMPYKEVGTDPRFIEVHGPRKVDDPQLNDLFDQSLKLKLAEIYAHENGKDPNHVVLEAIYLAAKAKQVKDGARTLDGKIATLFMLAAVTGTIERTDAEAKTSSVEQERALRAKYEFYREPAPAGDLAQYRARPLNGIAFTAPYGHNGAWPSLYDVLQPPAKRPKKFVVRPRSFDAEKVGIDTSPAKAGEKLFEIDTSTKANSKEGHVWGTDLSEADKAALLEYLKSL